MAKRVQKAESKPEQKPALRTGAKWLICNSRKGRKDVVRGSGILIYDAANRPAIEQTVLGEFGEQIFGEAAALKELKKDDRVWVFTVSLEERDGPFNVRWWVGSPPELDEVDQQAAAESPTDQAT
ncbi:MAG: hypothetical protein U0930_20090 [Pirellulales bacterium]